MRNSVAVVVAAIPTAVLFVLLSHLYRLTVWGIPLPAIDSRLGSDSLFIAIAIALVNATIGLPAIALLRQFGILSLPVVITAGAAAGVAIYTMLNLLPVFDSPAGIPTLMQQIAHGLQFPILGALSAAVLGYMLIPGSSITVERDARKGSARSSP